MSILLLQMSAFAQQQVRTNGQTFTVPDSGNILKQEGDFEKEREVIDKNKKIKETPDDVELEVPEEQDPNRVDTQSQVKFQVNQINVTGNTLVSDEEIRPLVEPYEGREVSLNELGKAVDAINKKYQANGFLTSQAFIPPQDIDAGVMTIEVVEGVVGVITMTGQKYNKPSVIARDIDVSEGDAFNIPDLEDAMNRVNRQKPYRLKAILRAGEKTGETDVDFRVSEQQPWQITPSWDNQGRPFVGTHRFGVTLTNNNVTGHGDRFYTSNYFAAGTQITANGYSIPINRFGTEIGYDFAYSHVDIDLGIPDQVDIDGDSKTHSIVVRQPLDKEGVFSIDLAANLKTVSTYLADVQTNQSKVASLTAGINFNKFDRYGRTFLRFQNDIAASRLINSNTSFWKASAYGNRLVALPKGMVFILRGQAQFTPDGLPPIEQFQIGGANSVRGYTEGLLFGDRGYSLSTELRYPIPGLKYVSPWLAQRVQGAAFFDIGQAWVDQSSTAYIPGFSHHGQQTLLMGTGLGVRAQLTRFLTGFVDFGYGITQQGRVELNAQPDVRVHFGVSSNLLPTNYKERGDETVYVNSEKRKEAKKQAKLRKREEKRLAKLQRKEAKEREKLAKKNQKEGAEQLNPHAEPVNTLLIEDENTSDTSESSTTSGLDLSLAK